MSIFVDNLETLVMSNAELNDEIIIISGYFSIDIIEKIARYGKNTTFYYGMYLRNGISKSNYNEFKRLEAAYPNLKINIPIDYHVHTKCYLFRKAQVTQNVLVGSANSSSSALSTTANSELLTPIDNIEDRCFLDNYEKEIEEASVHFDDPLIIPTQKTNTLRVASKRARTVPESWNNFTGDPFSAIIPLYCIKNDSPVVQRVDGLNWGNGPKASKSTDMESVLPIRAFHVKNYPLLIPFNGAVGSGTGGKSQRMQKPIEMIWDDGTKMTMLFQQRGVEVPPKGKRVPGSAYRQYPKALTASSGGVELGKYLRNRMNLPHDKEITYDDLRTYGRDYVTLTLTKAGEYELDFSV